MTTQYATVEVWVIVDSNGDYAATHAEEALTEAYTDAIGELDAVDGIRRVKVTVKVPLPTILEATAEVTEDAVATATAK